MKKSAVKLLISGISLALTVVLFVGIAVAWFATNTDVGGNSGGVDIKYEDSGGSADFVPGDGFGDDNPDALFPGDRVVYRFRLKNESEVAKNYVFRFNDLFVTYPPVGVGGRKDYLNAVTAADDYEYYEESSLQWIKYNGLIGAADAEIIEFYEKFVTAFTNAIKVAVVRDDGATRPDDAIAAAEAEDKFAYLTRVPSYDNANDGSVGYQGKTDRFLVDGTESDPKINDELAENCPLSSAAQTTENYMLLVVFDGNFFAESTIGGVNYRMKNSNAFLWQSLSATVVVKKI